jgi:hypothetical protein
MRTRALSLRGYVPGITEAWHECPDSGGGVSGFGGDLHECARCGFVLSVSEVDVNEETRNALANAAVALATFGSILLALWGMSAAVRFLHAAL